MPRARSPWILAVLLLAFNRAGGAAPARPAPPPAPAAVPQTAETPAARPADAAILADAPYELPALADLPPALRKEVSWQATPEQYEAVRAERRFTLRKLRYGSDGLAVVAYLYRPVEPGSARLPAVVYSRGSWVAGDQAPPLAPVFHRLARAGFVVVAPQYRGSDGGEGSDEMGGADVADVMNALALARNLPYVDPDNLFLYGESRGGMMIYQALRDGARVRAAATIGAFTDHGGDRSAGRRLCPLRHLPG